jgi:transcription initiation factor TFIID subunit 9B
MASTAGGGLGSAGPSSTTKQIPRDAVVMQSLLKEMGVTLNEPRVINQMLDFVYRK